MEIISEQQLLFKTHNSYSKYRSPFFLHTLELCASLFREMAGVMRHPFANPFG